MITGLANVLVRNCCLSEHQDFKFLGEECPEPLAAHTSALV